MVFLAVCVVPVGDCEGDGCKDARVDFVKVEVGGFEYFIEGSAVVL